MTTKNTAQISKTAVDSNAEKYWEEYFNQGGTAYGKLWVRKIPMRIQAALASKTGKTASKTGTKVASTQPISIQPIASVFDDKGLHLEGLVATGSGDSRKVQAFVIDFDADGNTTGFDLVGLE